MMTVQILMSLAGASPMMITAKFSGKTFVSKEMFSGHFLSASRHHSPIVVINIDPHKDGKRSLSKNLLVFHLLSFSPPRRKRQSRAEGRQNRKENFPLYWIYKTGAHSRFSRVFTFFNFSISFSSFLYLIQLEMSGSHPTT